ncbi:MAG: Prolyl oligopeptidase Serine peptidase, partial [Gammaproteobacteria bacterium]|nr:Prolyl oligopeptidase Serine peptidase [Gammaproteobacteria bacterium]
MGRVEGFFGEGKETETFFSYTEYLKAPLIYRFDVTSNNSNLWRKATVPASTYAYVTVQLF